MKFIPGTLRAMSSIDLKEFQEVKQRLRRSGTRQSTLRRFSLVFVIIAVFQLGIVGGIIISSKTWFKTETLKKTALIPQPPPVGSHQVHKPEIQKRSSPPLIKTAPVQAAPTRTEIKVPEAPKHRMASPKGKPYDRKMKKRQYPSVSAMQRYTHGPVSMEVAGGDIGRAYAAGMRTIIERHKEPAPIINGIAVEGRTVIVCIIQRDGMLRHAEVVRSSGNKLVDAAALRSVHKAGHFPKVPANVPGEEFSFDVPLAFRRGA